MFVSVGTAAEAYIQNNNKLRRQVGYPVRTVVISRKAPIQLGSYCSDIYPTQRCLHKEEQTFTAVLELMKE